MPVFIILLNSSVVRLRPACTLDSRHSPASLAEQSHVQSVWHKFWQHATRAQLNKCHTEYARDPRSVLLLMLSLRLPHLAGF